jgi:hypothetical protein
VLSGRLGVFVPHFAKKFLRYKVRGILRKR